MNLGTFIFLGAFSFLLYKVATREQEEVDCLKVRLEETYPEVVELLETNCPLEVAIISLIKSQKSDEELSIILNKNIKTNIKMEVGINSIEFHKSVDTEITLDEILFFLRCQIKALEIEKIYGKIGFQENPQPFKKLRTIRI